MRNKTEFLLIPVFHKIEDNGYPMQTYQFSFISDELKVHSTLLDRVAGVVTTLLKQLKTLLS